MIRCLQLDVNDLEKKCSSSPAENCSNGLHRSTTTSTVVGKGDSGNQCAFVNLSVKANLKVAPGKFHGCNSFN